MFHSPGLDQLDPAMLAFVKCHVTSAVKWEVLRILASQDGAWVRSDELARVWMLRVGASALCRAGFDKPPREHDGDTVANVLHDMEVVRDEEIRDLRAALHLIEQI